MIAIFAANVKLFFGGEEGAFETFAATIFIRHEALFPAVLMFISSTKTQSSSDFGFIRSVLV